MDRTELSDAQLAHRSLQRLTESLPVPTVPPRYPYAGISVGVGLLDAAINLNHVTRRTERLKIVDLDHLSRDVMLHISLGRLSPQQRHAAAAYGAQRGYPQVPGTNQPVLWVPITRVSRRFASPVRIFNNHRGEVPRATQAELLPLINGAMYQLLKLHLLGQPTPGNADSPGHIGQNDDKHRFFRDQPRARWLLQQAISSMIYCSHPPGDKPVPPPRDFDDPDRRAALEVLSSSLVPTRQAEFLELLYLVSTEYLVVAGLSSTESEHYLSYSAAAIPSIRSLPRVERTLMGFRRGLSPLGTEFTLRYKTELPGTLEAFHVVVETDEQTRISQALLVTAHDRIRCATALDRLSSTSPAEAEHRRGDTAEPKGRTQGLPTAIRNFHIGSALVDLATIARRGSESGVDGWLDLHGVWLESGSEAVDGVEQGAGPGPGVVES